MRGSGVMQDRGGKSRKPRRSRIDSAGAAVEIMKAALVPVEPPAHVPLGAEDRPFWESVIKEFARSEWTNHQLELAAMLARTMADLEAEQRALRAEGSVMKTDKGVPVVSPRLKLIQVHAASILSMRRSLQLHARARNGEARDTAKRRDTAKGIEADNPLHDPLLGPPAGEA